MIFIPKSIFHDAISTTSKSKQNLKELHFFNFNLIVGRQKDGPWEHLNCNKNESIEQLHDCQPDYAYLYVYIVDLSTYLLKT